MLNKEIIIKRLALIKLLYNNGMEQSKQPEPMNSFYVLSFHDSVEMFLKLLTEHLNVQSDKLSFIEYWDKVPTLTLKESFKKLNSVRVNVKHKGLLPSNSDIEFIRVTTTEFFNQNTIAFFNLEFADVSLVDLVVYESVRKYLLLAQSCLNAKKFEDSIANSSKAFNELIHVYETSKTLSFGSPFFFGKGSSFLGSGNYGRGTRKDKAALDKVFKSINTLSEALKLVALGIDYKKFVKFKLLTPIATRMQGGEIVLQLTNVYDKKWTQENCNYCLLFVVESALMFQNFDFEMSEILEEKELILEYIIPESPSTSLS